MAVTWGRVPGTRVSKSLEQRDAADYSRLQFQVSGRSLIVTHHLWRLWSEDKGQDIAEYAVMLAVILVLVVGTIRLIGSNANTVFSSAASSIQ
jgi:Flp pilus assembly pilin Flp